jgi:hypothetical protein
MIHQQNLWLVDLLFQASIGQEYFEVLFENLNPETNHACNGTAKVILQGRKYGLGSFVVTQRTANISKSILNQCNTIFALRVFDDTGKQFLENYIGSDYANVLPTLEERHCIAVGKAMRLKQPIILKLNNMENIIITGIENETTN